MDSIKELRKKTGLSQSQFAKKYHISLKTLQHWECEERKPPEHVNYLLSMVIDNEYKNKG